MKRILLKHAAVLACALSFSSAAFAGPLDTRSNSARADIAHGSAQNSSTGAPYGYILMDAASGEIISQLNADDLFIPASLSKIPTTLMTLNALGTERRFETRLLTDGEIVGGVLEGDLHLVGSGDPSLQKRDIVELVTKLKAAGVREVSGRFTYDPNALPRTAVIDKAQPAGQPYNPPVSGLNIDLNLRVTKGRKGPVAEPGRRAARMLRFFAHGKGITLPIPTRAKGSATGHEIAAHTSAPVARIARQMMDLSTNLTAESLGLLSVASLGETPKSLAAAANITSEWVKTEAGDIGGKGWRGFRMVNHSGLSTRSRATPRQIASILQLGYQRFGSTFTDLHKQNQPGGFQAYSLRGKFGTMRFVRGYGGFLTVGGREMIFTIMTNDRRRRALADAGKTGLRSHAWMRKARKLEQDVLSQWIAGIWSGNAPATRLVAAAPIVEPVQTIPLLTTSITPAAPRTEPWNQARQQANQPFKISTLSAQPVGYVRTTALVE